MANDVLDTFTDTSGTALTAHTGETGATWTKHPFYTSGTVPAIDGAGRLRCTYSDATICYASGPTTDADEDVTVTFHVYSTPGALRILGPCWRVHPTNQVAYVLWIEYSGSGYLLQVYRYNGDLTTGTAVGSAYTFSPTTGVDYTIKVSPRGANGTVYLDGASVITYTDGAPITAAGKVGVITYGTDSIGVGMALGDFSAAPSSTPGDTIPADNAGFRYYGRWAVASGVATTINNGSLVEFDYTGQSCTLLFDVTGISVYPIVATWIDGVGPTRTTLTSTGRLALTPAYNATPGGSPPYAAPASSRHRVRVGANVDGGISGSTNWATQNAALKFTGVEVDSGATLLAIPSSPDRIEFLGDSITAGLRVLYTTGAADLPAINAPELAWPGLVADLLGMRPIVNGHGSQGITVTGADGSPIANTAFSSCYSGAAWSPTVKPAVVVVYQGTNDTSFTSTQYQTFLATIRSAYPSAYIFAVVPHNKTAHVTPITTAVANLADARIFGLDYSSGVIASASDQSDSLGHLNPGGNVTLAAKLATDIRTQLDALGVKVQAGGSGSVPSIGSPFIRGTI